MNCHYSMHVRATLADHVRQRRMRIGLSVSKAAREAGFSRSTWIALEEGSRETQRYSYGAIERVLGWAPGSIDAIADGREPTIATPTQGTAAPGTADSAGDTLRMIGEVVDSDIDDETKVRLIRALLAEQRSRREAEVVPRVPRPSLRRDTTRRTRTNEPLRGTAAQQ